MPVMAHRLSWGSAGASGILELNAGELSELDPPQMARRRPSQSPTQPRPRPISASHCQKRKSSGPRPGKAAEAAGMPPDTQVPLPPSLPPPFLEDLGAVEHRVMGRYLEECRLEWEEYGQKLKAGSVSDLC